MSVTFFLTYLRGRGRKRQKERMRVRETLRIGSFPKCLSTVAELRKGWREEHACWHPIQAPVQVLPALLLLQLPACGPGKEQRMAQVLGSSTPVGNQEEAPGFRKAQLQPFLPFGE